MIILIAALLTAAPLPTIAKKTHSMKAMPGRFPLYWDAL